MTRPRIGLTANVRRNQFGEREYVCNRFYFEAVRAAGGEPVLIAPEDDPGRVGEWRGALAGLVFTGGPDLAVPGQPPHPKLQPMHPQRQAWDLALLEAALAWPEMPLFCICLGCQELNVACGGSLFPHLPDLGGDTEHRRLGQEEQWHPATVLAGSRLAGIVGTGEIQVNSSHHQAVDRLGRGLRVVARAPDGTVEALEPARPSARFVLAVQWHPERILDHVPSREIFHAFLNAARE